MIWKLSLTHNHQQSNEYCLTMTHLKRNCQLRQWFGPIAQQLFKQASYKHNIIASAQNQLSMIIDKQSAQHFLIEASFFHQKCVQLYHINQDLKANCLELTQEISELLLYLRMTDQHPTHENLNLFADCHMHCHLDFEKALKALIEANLIQKIEILHCIFYDKNPRPHDHIFDHQNMTLIDCDSIDSQFDDPKLITHSANTKVINTYH